MPNHRLLLIEDDFDVAEMLMMYFTSHQYDVYHADTGAEGIEIARTRFPNLILLDVMLPDMDGYDVCVRLRNTSLTKFIPTLFLTQKDERASKVKGLQLGADDYITKPFEIDELRLRVEGAIRRATRENLHEKRTGLPTGMLAEEEIRERIHKKAQYLRFTIEGFSAYSDVYSFMAANDVIYHAGKVIRDALNELGTAQDFVGILTDEFVVATHAADVPTLISTIKQRFAAQVRAFYTFADADRGGIILDIGLSTERFVPLMSFSAAEGASAV